MNGLPLYFTGLPSYLDFYVLNEQVAGTVPLYSVELVVKIGLAKSCPTAGFSA